MNLDLFIDNLREKYNYGEGLLSFIKKLIPSLIDYYGVEYQNIILDAFFSTPIIVSKIDEFAIGKKDDFTFNYDENDSESIFKRNEDSEVAELKYASGGLMFSVELEGNIPVVKRNLVVNFDINAILSDKNNIDFSKIGTFVHEICHMIKTNIRKNDNGSYDLHCGMSQYRVEIGDNGECELLDYNQGEGLDEALNYIDEVLIMRSYFDSQYKSNSNYSRLGNIIYDCISENEILMENIKYSMFNGPAELKKILGEELSTVLLLCNEHSEVMSTPVILRAIGSNTLDELKKKRSIIEERLYEVLSKIKDAKKR